MHAAATRSLIETRALGLWGLCNVARPGIGLYGYGLPKKCGLKPVLEWRALVLRTRRLNKGDRVGYGGEYTARGGETEAVLGCGYGDGLPRALAGGTIGRRKILGRVSMDLMSIAGNGLRVGHSVRILGESVDQGERLALDAGTIIYEILTGISTRVARRYR